MLRRASGFFEGSDRNYFKQHLGYVFHLSEEQINKASEALRGNPETFRASQVIINFLVHHILSYMKLFEAKLVFDSENNFYMEREWRLNANLQFGIDDVDRIFLPW